MPPELDVDVCPSRASENLARLSDALHDLGARLRVEGDVEGIPFDPHPDVLAKMTTMTLITEHGPLDLCFQPAGFPDGYASLTPGAITITISSVDLPVAALSDVVASKRAAGRPKDIIRPCLHSKFTFETTDHNRTRSPRRARHARVATANTGHHGTYGPPPHILWPAQTAGTPAQRLGFSVLCKQDVVGSNLINSTTNRMSEGLQLRRFGLIVGAYPEVRTALGRVARVEDRPADPQISVPGQPAGPSAPECVDMSGTDLLGVQSGFATARRVSEDLLRRSLWSSACSGAVRVRR